MITGVNHIGVVVDSIDSTLALMTKCFGAKEVERHHFVQLGQVSCIVELGDLRVELMEPMGEDGVVAKFLSNHGQGLHHVSLWSDDLDHDCAELEKEGVTVIGKSQNGEIQAAFTHPRSTFGVLFEISSIRSHGR